MSGAITEPSLRQRAEDRSESCAEAQEDLDALSPETLRKTLHELRVHQIELEMQNEELRVAHGRLEASQARYFELYDLAPAGYITVSEVGLILEANLTAATLLGKVRGDLMRTPIFRIILREDQDAYYQLRAELLETGDPQTCELRMTKSDGTAFWAHLAAASSQDEAGATVFRIVLNDITERRKTEEELRQVIHDLPLLILAVDAQDRIVQWNAECQKVTDYCPDEILGNCGALELICPGESFLQQKMAHQSTWHKGFSRWEGEVVCKDGDVKMVSWTSIVRSLAAAGTSCQSRCLFLIGVDVTEQRELERAILIDGESQSLSGMGQRLHDGVCQELVGICFLSELHLRSLHGSPAKTRDMAKKILAEAKRALGASRALAHGLMVPCDEDPSLENGLRILAKKMRDVFEVQCHLVIPSESFCCDPESSLHLIRIAQEAATNAIKHAMPQQIWVQLAMKDTVMIMSIENDGKNMRGNVDPQLSLGLRLMKFRTKRMGAALEIVPRAGGGTVVRCLFPLKRFDIAECFPASASAVPGDLNENHTKTDR